MIDLHKYSAIMVAGFKQELVYRLDYFFSLVFRILTALVAIFVWITVFRTTGASSIGGLTPDVLYAYFFIANAISIFTINDTVASNMQDDIQSGNITTSVVRPVKYPTLIFFNALANNFVGLLTVLIPFMIIIILVAHVSITPVTLSLFILEIITAYLITSALYFIIGSLAVYLVNIWGIISVADSLYLLLGGGVIPLILFPGWASQILLLLPSQLSVYTPAATLLGIISPSAAIGYLFAGVVWAVVLVVLAALWWKKVSQNITSVGG
ncbi:MAG: ABC-2 family transporter protein [Candidatus Micrarchaeota archaeon]|nr:ABC-2 family transporter protein [Candidatus Micrarchaeota archaeon]